MLLIVVLALVCGVIGSIFWSRSKQKNVKNVCVVVLGDIGRSPRMQNHAVSFAREGYRVDLIGYPGSTPLKQLREHPNVRVIYLTPPPDLQERLPRLIFYAVKVVWQSVSLMTALFLKRRSGYLLLQNPPAIPTIPICWIYCLLSGARFVIDWHNYAYTIQALSTGMNNAFVKLTRIVEFNFGRAAQANLCVSRAMKKNLQEKWNIKAQVLYDRPSDVFHPISLEEKHSFLLKLGTMYEELRGPDDDSTIYTERSSNGTVALRQKRPAFVVSSTSWTPDEDFSVLVEALQEYEDCCKAGELDLPDLVCFVTGKGPLKEFYTAIIERRQWEWVTVLTPWLENEDYPKILASADLGICLHTSSSSLDLPMKLVDMFGSGLPAFAWDYECLHELLMNDRNGMVFHGHVGLAKLLITRFKNFPNDVEQEARDKRFRDELKIYQGLRWHVNWVSNALPLFERSD